MSEVLVVAEQVDSHMSKPTLELLTLARRLGDPVAVVFAETDDAVAKTRRRPRPSRRSPPVWTRSRS